MAAATDRPLQLAFKLKAGCADDVSSNTASAVPSQLREKAHIQRIFLFHNLGWPLGKPRITLYDFSTRCVIDAIYHQITWGRISTETCKRGERVAIIFDCLSLFATHVCRLYDPITADIGLNGVLVQLVGYLSYTFRVEILAQKFKVQKYFATMCTLHCTTLAPFASSTPYMIRSR
jgi:hypothetical protein